MYHVIGLKQTRGIKNVTLRQKKIVGARGLLGRAVTGNGKYATGNMQRATGNEERVREIPKMGNLLACESHLGS